MPSPEATAPAWTEAGGIFRDGRMAAAGLRHGLTGRRWGDMRLGRNRVLALSAAGVPDGRALVLKQAHGTGLAVLKRGEAVPPPPEADGFLTERRGAAVAVQCADCLPIWLWDRGGRAAGVIHSGWRGLDLGMPRAAARRLQEEFGVPARELSASVGPHAGACCYEVGPEVARRFRAESMVRDGGRLRLDLAAEARAQLVEAGLSESEVSTEAPCTVCGEAFYSYRREGRAGNMLAFLWLEA